MCRVGEEAMHPVLECEAVLPHRGTFVPSSPLRGRIKSHRSASVAQNFARSVTP